MLGIAENTAHVLYGVKALASVGDIVTLQTYRVRLCMHHLLGHVALQHPTIFRKVQSAHDNHCRGIACCGDDRSHLALGAFPCSANALLESLYQHTWQAPLTAGRSPEASMPDIVFLCTGLHSS